MGCVWRNAIKKSPKTTKQSRLDYLAYDTDLLVLLCYYTIPVGGCERYIKPETKANSGKTRVWNIKKVKEQWGADVCGNILFIHAILGCDTKSRDRLHGIGKGASLKKFVSSPYFRQQASKSIQRQFRCRCHCDNRRECSGMFIP